MQELGHVLRPQPQLEAEHLGCPRAGRQRNQPAAVIPAVRRWGPRLLDAINALRKGGSTLAAVAKERAFKVGQKGSTFPWANSATALFDAMGRSWLASEIAIIGAASEHLLGSAKHPDNAAFGDRAHPAELLAQTRQNAGDASWWRQQGNIMCH